jgi:hypothetical protein
MEPHGVVKYHQEAYEYVTGVEDPITQRLLRMALVHFVLPRKDDNARRPMCDVDMRYVMSVLEEFLAEHSVLIRTLQGEKIGDFFEDD